MIIVLYENSYLTETQIYVYAKRTDVSDVMRACENLLGDKENNRKYLEDPFAFASIREYTMQDPMKNINWKASAKTGEFMVNTYTSMQNEHMMIYLDIEDKGILKKEHLTEDSISVAATLFQKLLNKGTEVGICVNLYDDARKNVMFVIIFLSIIPACMTISHREYKDLRQWVLEREPDYERALCI